MCTSIVSNKNKTIIGWNLDLGIMEYKVVTEDDKVFIAVNDATQGWLPLFGANSRGDFVAMPTCWPYDKRSDPKSFDDKNIIILNIDLLLGKRTFEEVRNIAESENICSVPGITYQSQLSNAHGNVLQIVPGQGVKYLERPEYTVMTNFSPFKGNSEIHPWMGLDRYETATKMLDAYDSVGVEECFEILKSTAQNVCPTVVSMVFDVEENTVYWCERQEWDKINKKTMKG